MHLFVRSFVCLFVHSFIHSFIYSLTHLFTHSFNLVSVIYYLTDSYHRRDLLRWVQSYLTDDHYILVDNFTTSWNTGIALCSLIDSLFPGACPQHDTMKPYHRQANCRFALKLANKYFEIPQVCLKIILSELSSELS